MDSEHMRKQIAIFLVFLSMFFVSGGVARALELTKIGTTDLTGKGIGSTTSAYTYSLRSFSLYGKSEASKSVSVKIDDVTYSSTANATGDWSTYLANLTYDTHQVTISATGETSLNFALTISSAAATPTPTVTTTASTTKGGTSSATLPVSGALDNTYLLAALAMIMFGVGVSLRYRN
jgi:hypothetical protein